MQEAIRHNGVSYYEVAVETEIHVDRAVSLANGYYCFPEDSPLVGDEICEFLTEFDPQIYNSFGPRSGSNEALLLYQKQPSILPTPRKALLDALKAQYPDFPLPYSPRTTVSHNSTEFVGLILIRPEVNAPYGLLVTAEALCRSPWLNPTVCAAWASNAIAAVSGALGGKSNLNPQGTPTEFQVAIPESDIPLCQAFKALGWLAVEYLPPLEEDSLSGQILFSFMVGTRPRKDMLRYFAHQDRLDQMEAEARQSYRRKKRRKK